MREVESRIGLFDRLAECFVDHRHPNRVKHPLRTLLAQRIFGVALGYEDLNDHDERRHDSVLALMAGHPECTGARGGCRQQQGDGDHSLAGSSTLNRLEPEGEGAASDRYQRIEWIAEKMDRLLVD